MFIRRIWKLLEEDRRLMVGSVLAGLCFTGLGILPPLLVRQMIRRLDGQSVGTSFMTLGLMLAAIYLMRGCVRYLYGLSSHVAAYRTLHRLTNRVFQHLQGMSASFFDRNHSGNLVARTMGDVEAVEDFIAHGIPETMLAIVIPITMSIVLFVINWQLALVALIPLPIVALMVYVIATRTRNTWRGVRRRFAEVSARLQDYLAGILVLQAFGREQDAARSLEQQSREYSDRIIYANCWSLVPAGIIEMASGAGLVLVVVAGAWMVDTPDQAGMYVEVADLVVFLMYLGQIFLPFLRLANLTDNLQKAAASAERVFEVLDLESEISDSPQAAIPGKTGCDIVFDQVGFSYQPGEPVLQDASFHVAEGEIVALVGETGVGKSTACHLLLRFYDHQGGAIRLGGNDIRELPLKYLREQIGMVSQDIFLFEGSIRENLLMGSPGATESELEVAVQAAHAKGFIESFPDGYDTLVGERGIRLSGGQKQRIGIARALLKDAPVLLLDEATSAVDVETERAIKEAVLKLVAGRTVLIVAHRLSTIRAADRIVVLEGGRVVE
ncbi:MAG: ABC transporter ATP-binding protein, partial [Planctomycetaceae bacterium]|nr:ABC transporter ATP-binding protein [Planctomycetaceae bacterium]